MNLPAGAVRGRPGVVAVVVSRLLGEKRDHLVLPWTSPPDFRSTCLSC